MVKTLNNLALSSAVVIAEVKKKVISRFTYAEIDNQTRRTILNVWLAYYYNEPYCPPQIILQIIAGINQKID